MKFKLLLGLALVLGAGAGVSYHQKVFGVISVWEAPRLLASMRAKEFCSCHFMLGNEKDYCLKRVIKGYPVFKFEVDSRNRRVVFDNHISSASAVVKSPRLGCLLE